MGVEDVDVEQSTIEVDEHPMRKVSTSRRKSNPVLDAHRTKVFGALFAQPTLPRFGRYIVLDMLGEGGMGVVLKGYDDELDRQVAIKVLHTESTGRHRSRLKREAQAMAKLSHPNVVQVYEVGEFDGQIFIVMELIRGRTLRAWQRNGSPRSWRECLEVYLQAGRGLAAAHTKGLVHRDFKPGNAIVDEDGRVRVLDFGLARQDEDGEVGEDSVPSLILRVRSGQQTAVPLDVSLTRTGAVLGTPAYMPPEQMAGGETSALSDQFSFCVALYEALYGERPFAGESIPELMDSILADEVREPPLGNGVPDQLRRVLMRGLSSDPHQRWPSMAKLLVKLRQMLGSVADQEIVDLRRHVDVRLGVGAWRTSTFVGAFSLLAGLYAHVFVEAPSYEFLVFSSIVPAVLVIGYIAYALRRGSVSLRSRPLSLMIRTQMSILVAMSITVAVFPWIGWAFSLPIHVTAGFVWLVFALFVGAMGVFLPLMFVPAAVFILSSALTLVCEDGLWLWWSMAGGGGLWLMGGVWYELNTRGSPSRRRRSRRR